MSDDNEIDRVVDSRVTNGRKEFLVKRSMGGVWFLVWESEDSLQGSQDLIQKYLNTAQKEKKPAIEASEADLEFESKVVETGPQFLVSSDTESAEAEADEIKRQRSPDIILNAPQTAPETRVNPQKDEIKSNEANKDEQILTDLANPANIALETHPEAPVSRQNPPRRATKLNQPRVEDLLKKKTSAMAKHSENQQQASSKRLTRTIPDEEHDYDSSGGEEESRAKEIRRREQIARANAMINQPDNIPSFKPDHIAQPGAEQFRFVLKKGSALNQLSLSQHKSDSHARKVEFVHKSRNLTSRAEFCFDRDGKTWLSFEEAANLHPQKLLDCLIEYWTATKSSQGEAAPSLLSSQNL